MVTGAQLEGLDKACGYLYVYLPSKPPLQNIFTMMTVITDESYGVASLLYDDSGPLLLVETTNSSHVRRSTCSSLVDSLS